jgi:hypothetical protein
MWYPDRDSAGQKQCVQGLRIQRAVIQVPYPGAVTPASIALGSNWPTVSVTQGITHPWLHPDLQHEGISASEQCCRDAISLNFTTWLHLKTTGPLIDSVSWMRVG